MKTAAAVIRSIASRLAPALFVLLLLLLPFRQVESAATDAFGGTYSGSFDGALSGFWIAVFDSKGFGRFVCWSEDDQTVDYGIGNVTSEGRITFQTYLGMSIKAEVEDSGDVSGVWSLDGISGGLDGSRQAGRDLELLAGTYRGTYDGAESGTWQISVGKDGLISGYFVASATKTTFSVQGGAVNGEGNFAMRISNETSVTGDLDGGGEAAGSWYRGVASGQVNGSKQVGVASTGSSGSGGCFIQAAQKAVRIDKSRDKGQAKPQKPF